MKRQGYTNKLLVLGIDGMDPRLAKRMMDDGRMPNLKKFCEKGSTREDMVLLGAIPTITPPCWTTLATGAYPGTHGITCYWRQSPDSLDAVVYNMDSRNCVAEQMWNVTTEAGLKTLVWHWPGSSWPPSSNSELLHVVDGTQPGSVNMGVAQMDWEKIIVATPEIEKVVYAPRVEKAAGVGCIMTDIDDMIATNDEEDEMMEIWWGDKSREGMEIRTYVTCLDDTEMMIGAKVAYDIINSPLKDAEKWAAAPEGAKEFTVLTSGGIVRRPALMLKNENGEYDRVAIYKNKKATEPIVVVPVGEMVSAVDEVTKKEETKPCYRSYKLLELDPKGTMVRLWISNALDISNDMLWHPTSLHEQVLKGVGNVPPVSLIGGEESELVDKIFEPSWDVYDQWQADSLLYLIKQNNYDVVFSHLHNVDCAGHQIWHLGHTLEPWKHTDEKVYQGLIERFYEQTDRYFERFLPLLDEGWTILLLSDHGLIVGENVPPILGEYGGLNTKVMEDLGYTVTIKDETGRPVDVDWEKTRAVQIRSNYIYINLKGRDAHGIVEPEDKYALEEQIINDLYNYRDPETGKRVVGICLRNKDGVLLGVNGPECGDIFFSIEEGFNRLHGDSLSTSQGYFNTSVSPFFVAAGKGIKENYITERTIRQVDVTPTIAALLGTRFPAQCEGAPVYQILSEDF